MADGGDNEGQNMATNDVREGSINLKSLVWLTGGVAAVVGSVIMFQSWFSDWSNRDLRAFAYEYVFPRLDSLERTAIEQARFNDQVLQAISKGDEMREGQLKELKRLYEEQSGLLKQSRTEQTAILESIRDEIRGR